MEAAETSDLVSSPVVLRAGPSGQNQSGGLILGEKAMRPTVEWRPDMDQLRRPGQKSRRMERNALLKTRNRMKCFALHAVLLFETLKMNCLSGAQACLNVGP